MKGLKPSPNDILGDHWSNEILKVWDIAKALDPTITEVPSAKAIFQWLHCELSGMTGRIVASPEALAICGKPLPTEEQQDRLIALSDRAVDEYFIRRDGVPQEDPRQEQFQF